MDLILVRHAEAVHRADWTGDDLNRPLTGRGRRVFVRFIRSLQDRLPAPHHIVSSSAVRAVETARLCADAFGKKKVEIDKFLNPGCTPARFRSFLREYRKSEALLVVGHEPDLSRILEHMTGARNGTLRMAKGALAHLECEKRSKRLRLLMAP